MKRGQKMILNIILLLIKIFIILLILDVVGIGVISLLRHITIKRINKIRSEKEDV